MSERGREIAWRALGLLYFFTFGGAAYEKLKNPTLPDWFVTQFTPTILGSVPGLVAASYVGIAIAELIAATLLVWALSQRKPLISSNVFAGALLLSFALFIVLGFGQRLSHKYEDAAMLFLEALMTFGVLQFTDFQRRRPLFPSTDKSRRQETRGPLARMRSQD